MFPKTFVLASRFMNKLLINIYFSVNNRNRTNVSFPEIIVNYVNKSFTFRHALFTKTFK